MDSVARDMANGILRGFARRGSVTVQPQARAVWERELPVRDEPPPTPAQMARDALKSAFNEGKVLDDAWFEATAVFVADTYLRAWRVK